MSRFATFTHTISFRYEPLTSGPVVGVRADGVGYGQGTGKTESRFMPKKGGIILVITGRGNKLKRVYNVLGKKYAD